MCRAFLVVCGPQATAKSLSPHDLVRSGSKSDIRNLWTKATLSQPKLNVQLTNVYEDSDQEDSGESRRAGQWYKQKTDDSEGAWERWSERNTEGGIWQEELGGHPSELEQSPRGSQRNDGEGVEDFGSKMGQCGFLRLWVPSGQGAGWPGPPCLLV